MNVKSQKQFCIKYINNLDSSTRENILRIILIKVNDKCISEHADGTRILLDNIDPIIISEIYNLIKNNL